MEERSFAAWAAAPGGGAVVRRARQAAGLACLRGGSAAAAGMWGRGGKEGCGVGVVGGEG